MFWLVLTVTVLTVLVKPVLKVRADSLALKVDQSAEVRSPLLAAEELGKLKVWVEVAELMLKSVPVEPVAKD
jgi:hypothetical protein